MRRSVLVSIMVVMSVSISPLHVTLFVVLLVLVLYSYDRIIIKVYFLIAINNSVFMSTEQVYMA